MSSDTQTMMLSDPRIQAAKRQRPSGSMDASELRALGYDVPDGYRFVWGGRAGYGTLMDNKRGFIEKAAPVTAIGMGAAAGLGAAGAIPGIGGSAAGSATGVNAGVGSLGASGLPGGAAYGAAASAPGAAGGLGAALGGGSLLGKVLTGLKNYLPLGLAGVSAYKGLTQGPTDAENQLNEILGIAKNRVSASEPLFNELNASAMGDADRMRSRQAQADPMFEMLSKMTRSQMPRYTREG